MKKKYLVITAIGLLFLTGCGKKNVLKCTVEEKDEAWTMKTVMEIEFDSETKKYKSYDTKMTADFDDEETAKGLEPIFSGMCDTLEEKESCKLTRDGKTIEIVAKGVKNAEHEGKTREDAIKELEKEGMKCS